MKNNIKKILLSVGLIMCLVYLPTGVRWIGNQVQGDGAEAGDPPYAREVELTQGNIKAVMYVPVVLSVRQIDSIEFAKERQRVLDSLYLFGDTTIMVQESPSSQIKGKSLRFKFKQGKFVLDTSR